MKFDCEPDLRKVSAEVSNLDRLLKRKQRLQKVRIQAKEDSEDEVVSPESPNRKNVKFDLAKNRTSLL
jgi:hypothetical protein